MWIVAWKTKFTNQGDGFKVFNDEALAIAKYEEFKKIMEVTEFFENVYLAKVVQQ